MKQVFEYNRNALTDLLIADMKQKGVSFDGYAGASFEFELDRESDELSVKVELKKADEVPDALKRKKKKEGKMTPKEFSEFMDELLVALLKGVKPEQEKE